MKKAVQKAKDLKSNYYKSTPSKMRKIGDAIQDIGLLIGAFTAVTTNPWIGVIAIATGRAGKIITNFWSE